MKEYILSIDSGTSGITILLIDEKLTVVKKFYSEIKQYYPKPGWVEHDPIELINKIMDLSRQAIQFADKDPIKTIGITNQRETIVAWNEETGQPLHNAIVWQCRRTTDYCKSIKNEKNNKNIFNKTGLYIDSYFSSTKIKWILDNVQESKSLIKENKLMFGTIDTWIIWNLTKKKVFATDFTNASRTMLYNINKRKWDQELLDFFNIPKRTLPTVKNSMDDYGIAKIDKHSIPINGVAGDQQSSLFGQGCFNKYSNKCTYGTGLFYLINTGNIRIDSKNGLLSTLAIDKNGRPTYAIEGSIFIGGALIQWLRDELGIINNANETGEIASKTKSTNGVYIVPAFVGMGAPYWNSDCRGIITGLTRGTNKNHIIRAALEAIAYQVYDLINCIKKDINFDMKKLNVDGGASMNEFLLQFQSDILNMHINRSRNIESTAMGCAILAGMGIGLWDDIESPLSYNKTAKTYIPIITSKERNILTQGWNNAIKKL